MYLCLCVCVQGKVGGDQARKSKEYRMNLGFLGSSRLPLYQFVFICIQIHKNSEIITVYSESQWSLWKTTN